MSKDLNKEPSIFDFIDVVDFLTELLAYRQNKNSAYSLRAFSKHLGFDHPSYLSRLLQRNTDPKDELVEGLSSHLNYSEQEKKYLLGISALSRLPNARQRGIILENLFSLRPEAHKELDALHIVQFLHSWLHTTVLEMLSLDIRVPVAKNIADRLGYPVTAEQVEHSLNLLQHMGLIEKTNADVFVRIRGTRIKWSGEQPNASVLRFHRLVLQRVQQQLRYLPFDKRDLRSSSVCLSKANYKKASEILKEAHRKILDLNEGDKNPKDEIYVLSTQLVAMSGGQE